MSNHTPGPWRVGNLLSYDAYTGRPFRNVWAGEGNEARVIARAIHHGDVDANAQLISVSPELLESLKRLLNRIVWDDSIQRFHIPDGSMKDFLTVDAIRNARTAVLKADGSDESF